MEARDEPSPIAGIKRPREEIVAPDQPDGAPAEPEEALVAEPLTADGAAPADEALNTTHAPAAGSEGVEAHAVAPVPAAVTADAAEEADGVEAEELGAVGEGDEPAAR